MKNVKEIERMRMVGKERIRWAKRERESKVARRGGGENNEKIPGRSKVTRTGAERENERRKKWQE